MEKANNNPTIKNGPKNNRKKKPRGYLNGVEAIAKQFNIQSGQSP
jgi:hypothetical protein